MNAEQLSRVGEKLVKRCGSRDPFEIARQLGINVMLCENFGSLKGMYRVIKRNRFIFLNNSLDENMLRIVCAHELGHDQLHRNMAKTTPIHEFMPAFPSGTHHHSAEPQELPCPGQRAGAAYHHRCRPHTTGSAHGGRYRNSGLPYRGGHPLSD